MPRTETFGPRTRATARLGYLASGIPSFTWGLNPIYPLWVASRSGRGDFGLSVTERLEDRWCSRPWRSHRWRFPLLQQCPLS